MPPPPHVVPVAIEVAEPPPTSVDPGTATPPAREKPVTSRPPTPPPATPPPTTAPPDPPVLQTSRNADELETRARADLIRADQILSKIEVSRLSGEARGVFDSATSFKRQAEDALREKNFAAAALHANKALTFAQALTKSPTT
jgi:hypothetical protein